MWRYLARRVGTGEWLHWDVPLSGAEPEWELSGPGSVKGSITSEFGSLIASDGRPILEEWGTLLYAENGGQLRWGGIVEKSRLEGEVWQLEAAGFSSYPHGRVYRGEYVRTGVDPADVIGHIWQHLQGFPDGDLGVTVVGDKTPIRLGDLAYAVNQDGVRLEFAIPHKQWEDLFAAGWVGGPVNQVHVSKELWTWLLNNGFTRAGDGVVVPPASWSEAFPWWEAEILSLGWVGGPVRQADVRPELWQYLVAHGWAGRPGDPDVRAWPPTMNDAVLQSDDAVVEAAPYQLLWWETPNCGQEINELLTSSSLDYTERVAWDGEDVSHELVLAYPRAGRRRDDLAFIEGDNVTDIGAVDTAPDDYANNIVGLGVGEGRAVLITETGTRDGRLARDYVHVDKAITSEQRLDAAVRTELAYRSAGVRVTSLQVIDHPNAPIGSWQVGDDVLLRANLPRIGEIREWVRITRWTLTGDETAALTVARSDSFRYGGS